MDKRNINIWNKITPEEYRESCKDINSIMYRSHMYKLSDGSSKHLIRRYFVLRKNYRLYYCVDEFSDPTSFIDLYDSHVMLPNKYGWNSKWPKINIRGQYCIQIAIGSKYTLFYCEDSKEFNIWIRMLSRICKRTDFHERFEPLRRIFQKDSKDVLECKENEGGQRYIVKAVSKSIVDANLKLKLSLQSEINNLRKINHINIVKLFEVHESQSSIYLIMELVEGFNLSKVLKNHAHLLIEKDIMNIVEGLLRGIEHLASLGIVHRDLRMENILLRKIEKIEPDDVCIIGFGHSVCNIKDESLNIYLSPKRIDDEESPSSFEKKSSSKKSQSEHSNKEIKSSSQKNDVQDIGLIAYCMLLAKNIIGESKEQMDHFKKSKMHTIDMNLEKLSNFNRSFLKLISSMIRVNIEERVTATEALENPVFEGSEESVQRYKTVFERSNTPKGSKKFKLNLATTSRTVDQKGSLAIIRSTSNRSLLHQTDVSNFEDTGDETERPKMPSSLSLRRLAFSSPIKISIKSQKGKKRSNSSIGVDTKCSDILNNYGIGNNEKNPLQDQMLKPPQSQDTSQLHYQPKSILDRNSNHLKPSINFMRTSVMGPKIKLFSLRKIL